VEQTPLFDTLGLLAIVVFVLSNAFFVAAEFSLVSVRRTRIAELVERGLVGADVVQKALENPDRVIAATQLGITLSSLALGWAGEPALSHLILPLVSLFPRAVQSGVSHSLSAAIAFLMITFMHVVVGELAPKSIALQDPERTALVVAGPTLFIERLFKPAIWALNGTGNALLRLIGVQPASGHQLVHSVEELKLIVSASAEGGVVQAEEREMLNAVFDFGDLVVRQVTVPRTEVVAVEADTPLEEIVSLVTQTTYTKFPVYEDSLDQVIGIVHVRDLLNALKSTDRPACVARDIAREPLFVPETLLVRDLLRLFRENRRHMAIVMDEFGGTAGVVTLEDLLEEIVGEVSTLFDITVPGFETQPDGSILIDGLIQVEDVNDHLGLDLKEPDYDTIGGYVMGKLSRIPELNDQVEADGVRLKVAEMDGLRVARVSLTRLDAPAAASAEPETPA
jgi:CBS domain containing-hemolysin-like protein